MKFATKCLHAYEKSVEHAVVFPIFQTSTFKFDSVEKAAEIFSSGKKQGDDQCVYTRGSNPTIRALERTVAALEGAEGGVAFSSGMAAITAVALATLKKGDHAICTKITYGETHHLFAELLPRFGVKVSFVDTSDVKLVGKALRKNTKLIFVETPCNPTLKLSDIRAIVRLKKQALLCVDNTFMSPYLQNPISLGADAVVHSMTKYIGGHSDLLGGIVLANGNVLLECRQVLYTTGGVLDPFAAWLALRGIKTLPLRVQRQEENARKIAAFLDAHPKIAKVNYPGLRSHPQHALAKKQARGFGTIISFELKSGLKSAKKMLNSVKLCTLSVSLGAVETLIESPAAMTHSIIPRKKREESGITDGLVRISVGVEDADDLIADLRQALKRA